MAENKTDGAGKKIAEIAKGVGSALGSALGAENKTDGADKKIAEIAKSVGSALGAGLVAAGDAAVKFGADFETGMAKVSTRVDTAAVDMDKVEQSVLDLSNQSGVASAELAKVMYNALSAGVKMGADGADMMAFLEHSTRLAKAGCTDMDTAVATTAKVLDAYKMDVSETERVHKVLMQTQNLGITTVGELGAALEQVTPTASAMGVSFEQVGASLASMASQQIPAADATAMLNALLLELGSSGTAAADHLAEATENTQYAGMSFAEMMKSGVPLNEVLSLMSEHADANGLSLMDMVSSSEAATAALALSGENTAQYTDNLKAMSTELDVVGDAYDTVTGTSAEQFGQMMNQLKNVAIELFGQLQPLIVEALPILKELFEELAPPVLQMTEELLPLIGEILGEILPQLADLAEEIMPILISLFDALLPPIIQLIEEALPPLVELINALLPILQVIVELLEPLMELFVALLEPILNLILDALVPLIKIIGVLIEVAMKPLEHQLGLLESICRSVMDGFVSYIDRGMSRVKDSFGELLDFIRNVFTGNWSAAWENIKNIFINITDSIGEWLRIPMNTMIDTINGFLDYVSQITIPDWVPVVGGMGFDMPTIPHLASGGLAFEEQLALVGDNPNARFDPEVIAPLSKLSSMIQTAVYVEMPPAYGYGGAEPRQGGGLQCENLVDRLADTLVIREEADIAKIAKALYQEVTKASRGKGGAGL